MTEVVVDTSVLIDFLRSDKKPESFFFQLVESELKLYISIITHSELFSGKSVWESRKAKKELNILLSGLEVIPLGENQSRLAGQIRAEASIDLIDAIIAATALVQDAYLATLNLKDFDKVDSLQLYPSSP